MAGLGEYTSWFDRYRRSFAVALAAEQRNLDLKADHTLQVQENMGLLIEELGIAEPLARLARLIALFHDVGRFPQYCRYKTFKDSESENHGALGARVLVEEGVLAKLNERERTLVIRGVTLHNVFALPAGLDGESLLLLQLIRDADKLDIWRVFIEYYTAPAEERADAVALGFSDDPYCSQSVLAAVRERQMVRLDSLQTLNDFKLLQLSWVYDLNTLPAARLFNKRGYLAALAATLPDTPEVGTTVAQVASYLKERVGS
jgi:hypothetical protein